MKTYTIAKQDLIHLLELQDIMQSYQLIMYKYVGSVICPKFNIDPNTGKVTYDLAKGILTYEEHKQPLSQDKPVQNGDSKPPASGNV